MAANLQGLFDSFEEGLMIVGSDGTVRLANQAACRYFPVVLGKPLTTEQVLVQLSAVGKGYVRLPLEFDIAAPMQKSHRDRLRLRLMDSPTGSGYLLLVRNVTEAQRFDIILANLASLMSVEVEQPMQAFARRLHGLLDEVERLGGNRGELAEAAVQTIRQGRELAGRMQQLATFAKAFDHSPILAADRIPVMDLLAALLLRVKPLIEAYRINVHVADISGEPPVIYGSRDWLVEALYGYIEYTIRHCRTRSDLEIVARPYGNFVNVQVRNRGRALPKHVEARSFLPFSRPGTDAGADKTNKEAPEHDLGLGLALCKRIVELHRGHIRIQEEEGEILSFDMELPAGAPPDSVAPNLDSEQARRYAEDLTRLLARQRAAGNQG